MDQRVIAVARCGHSVRRGRVWMNQAVDQAGANDVRMRYTAGVLTIGGCAMRHIALEPDRRHDLSGCRLHTCDISIDEANRTVASVVARERLSQADLHVPAYRPC